jgi:hypothetical protein
MYLRLPHSGYLYQAWADTIRRCHDPRHWHFDSYGARGIEVCPEWRASFEAFAWHIGPRPSSNHSLDRIDNDRGYEPGNVRWATREEQMSNTRRNRRITFAGRTMTLSQWARELGTSRQRLHYRLVHRRLTVEQAFARSA